MRGQYRSAGARTPHVLKDPAPSVGVVNLGYLAVMITTEPWTTVVRRASAQG